MPRLQALVCLVLLGAALALHSAAADPAAWRAEWPRTDFARRSIDLAEILSGGPPKDGIPSIDRPRFAPVGEIKDLSGTEPVIGLVVDGDARAYPLRILTWHEIVNDEIGGVPVAVTYCPLCNAAIVFDRRHAGRVLSFGTTGKLRHSDLVMYDRQTESWWQQFLGEAIVGELTGARLDMLPARLESFANFKARAPLGRVLVPNEPRRRAYGANPYQGYDSADRPFLFRGELPTRLPAMARVVAVGKEAWSLDLLARRGRIETRDLVIGWSAGQASALDAATVAGGRDVGNVLVQRRVGGGLVDVPHDVTFAFVFHAFHPDGVWHVDDK